MVHFTCPNSRASFELERKMEEIFHPFSPLLNFSSFFL
jgi:hypothetical protein